MITTDTVETTCGSVRLKDEITIVGYPYTVISVLNRNNWTVIQARGHGSRAFVSLEAPADTVINVTRADPDRDRVEAMAIALWVGKRSVDSWNPVSIEIKKYYRKAARAALTALREYDQSGESQ